MVGDDCGQAVLSYLVNQIGFAEHGTNACQTHPQGDFSTKIHRFCYYNVVDHHNFMTKYVNFYCLRLCIDNIFKQA